eukprot:1991607-Prymnesium_polylepis.1
MIVCVLALAPSPVACATALSLPLSLSLSSLSDSSLPLVEELAGVLCFMPLAVPSSASLVFLSAAASAAWRLCFITVAICSSLSLEMTCGSTPGGGSSLRLRLLVTVCQPAFASAFAYFDSLR